MTQESTVGIHSGHRGLGPNAGTERPPPRFLFLQSNQRCNLRCVHCFYWRLDDSNAPNYLSRARRLALIREFAELGGEALVTCGGEPMLDLEDYFALMGAARDHGLRALSVVNGTCIQDRETAERMIASGPTEITVSLDHWLPYEHDRLRGMKGAFRQAERAIDLLLQARARLRSTTPIYVMTILSQDTWPTLDYFYAFALDTLGVDKLKLNVLQPSFQSSGPDPYFQRARVLDVEACMAKIAKCDQRWNIPRNPAWTANVRMYLESAGSIAPPGLAWETEHATTVAICNTYDRNVMIDLYGRARLCFSGAFPHVLLSQYGDLTRFWREQSLPIREKMLGCRKFCGISHSVRAEPSLLQIRK